MRSPKVTAAALAATASLLTACAAQGVSTDALRPRAAEAIDPRVPVVDTTPIAPADAALTARLDQLIASARATTGSFDSLAATARSRAAAAGSAQSESWIEAQQLLSALVGARAPVTRALGDADAIQAEMVARQGGVGEGNRRALEEALATIAAIDAEQAATVAEIQARLQR